MALLFRLALVLIVMAGSALMAPSRLQMAGMTQISICAGADTTVLTLDRRGNPVTAPHLCPDCMLTLGAAPLPAPTTVQRFLTARAISLPLPRDRAVAGLASVKTSARDPPLFV